MSDDSGKLAGFLAVDFAVFKNGDEVTICDVEDLGMIDVPTMRLLVDAMNRHLALVESLDHPWADAGHPPLDLTLEPR